MKYASFLSLPWHLLLLLPALALFASSCALYEELEALDRAYAVHTIEISPDPARIEVFQNAQFTARLYDQAGQELRNIPVEWSSATPSIVTIDETGLASAKATGEAHISAHAGPAQATVKVTVYAAVKRIEIHPPSLAMSVGQKEQLTAQIYGENDELLSGRSVEWSSTDESVVTIDRSGQIQGISEGRATIRAQAAGLTATAEVSVEKPVDHIKIDPAQATIDVKETLELEAKVYDTAGETSPDRVVTWTSSRPDVASVSESGIVTGHTEGSTRITAQSGGKHAEARIEVLASTKSITVSPNPASVNLGEEIQLTARAFDAANNELTGRPISWESSNESIATITTNGLVTGLAQGRVTITASHEGTIGTTRLDVHNPVVEVTISPNPVSLEIHDTRQLTATLKNHLGDTLDGRTITWRSLDQTIVEVDDQGLITAKRPGTVQINATSEGITGSTTVTVQNTVRSVEIFPATPSVEVTDTISLEAFAKNALGETIPGKEAIWSSSTPSIAQISADGMVTGQRGGTATISARIDDITAQTEITVEAPARSITLAPANPSIEITQTAQLTATLRDKAGNIVAGSVNLWTSDDPAIATVDNNGEITAHAGGSTTITASTDQATGSATITVETPPRSLELSPSSNLIIDIAQTRTVTAIAKDRAGNTLTGITTTWSSSNTNIATITSTGAMTAEVRGQAMGASTITASIAGGQYTETLRVDVIPSVHSIEIFPERVGLFTGERAQLTATLFDADNNPIPYPIFPPTWSSDDPSIATVDSSGEVTAVSPGQTRIKATSGSISASAQIDVLTWQHISNNQHHSCGVLSNGDAYCWGRNNTYGVLGNGSIDSGADSNNLNDDANALVPTPVSGDLEFAMVTIGIFHACGLTPNGKAYCWGAGGAGHLGAGAGIHSSPFPVPVVGNYTFTDIQLGANHTCALSTDQYIYCWGHNGFGQIGQSPAGDDGYFVPQRVGTLQFQALATGTNHSCGIGTDNSTYCWGNNDYGQLGDGTNTTSSSPTPVQTTETFVALASKFTHTCGLTAGGKAYCWGDNDNGALGNGNTTHSNTPVAAAPTHTFEQLTTGTSTTCGITANQDAYCWGFNGQGNLGFGYPSAEVLTPTLVTGGYKWESLSLGLQHTCGIASGYDTLFCWGDNDYGQIGNGNTEDFVLNHTPAQNP